VSSMYYGSKPGQVVSPDSPDWAKAGVLLTRLEVLEYSREPQYLGPNYLYTTYRIVVRGIFSPEVNAYDMQQGPSPYAMPQPAIASALVATAPARPATAGIGNLIPAAPGGATRDRPLIAALFGVATGTVPGQDAAVGNLPLGVAPGQCRGAYAPITDQAVRHFMLQPQRQLIYSVGTTPTLVSPSLNDDGSVPPTDANNGPMPLFCNVVYLSGIKAFEVEFGVETYVNEAQIYVKKPSVLLAHRWQAIEDIDQDFYQTRTINGIAKFRTDRLAYLGAVGNPNVPDDFRQALFHDLPGVVLGPDGKRTTSPYGWKRTLLHIDASEDGTTLSYTLQDKQTYMNIVPEAVSRIEAFMTVSATPASIEQGIRAGLGEVGGALGKKAGATVKPGEPAAVPVKGAGAAAAAQTAMKIAASMIPTTTLEVTFRVWGYPVNPDPADKRTVREVLRATAMNGILQRLAAWNNIANFTAMTEVSMTEDLGGTFCECTVSKTSSFTSAGLSNIIPGAIQSFYGDVPGPLGTIPALWRAFAPRWLGGAAPVGGVIGGGAAAAGGKPGVPVIRPPNEMIQAGANIPYIQQYFVIPGAGDSTPGVLQQDKMSQSQARGLLNTLGETNQGTRTRGAVVLRLATAALLNPNAPPAAPPPPMSVSGAATRNSL